MSMTLVRWWDGRSFREDSNVLSCGPVTVTWFLSVMLGGPHSLALKVNQAGQVFGRSLISATSSIAHGFVWTDNGGMMDLGPLPPTLNDVPETNNTGQMIFYTANQVERGFLWTPHSGSVNLGTLEKADTVQTWGLNNLGDVVGSADTAPEGLSHAFIWTPTEGMVDLGTLGGSLSGATDVNDERWVVGQSRTDLSNANLASAFLWTPERAEGMVGLGTLRGGSASLARAVSNRGQIVGVSSIFFGQDIVRGSVWTNTTGMVELSPLPGYLSSIADFVSNEGHIVGSSANRDGFERLTMWVVPPPDDTGDGWTFCAPEGGVCEFSGTMEVRYGANGLFFFKTLTDGAASTTRCSAILFPGPSSNARSGLASADRVDLCASEGGVSRSLSTRRCGTARTVRMSTRR